MPSHTWDRTYLQKCSVLVILVLLDLTASAVTDESEFAGPYPTADHYWPLYKTNYSIVYDTVGYAHGDVHGVDFVNIPRLGNVLSLGGERAWVDFGAGLFPLDCFANPIFCMRGFSVAFWIRMRGGKNVFASGGLTNSTGGTGVKMTYDSDLNVYHIKVIGDGRLWYIEFPAVLNSWCHVAITWSFTYGLRLFVDGEMQKSNRDGQPFKIEYARFSKTLTLGKPLNLLDLPSFGNFDMAHLALWYYEMAFDQARYSGKLVLKDSLEATVRCFAKAVDACYQNPCKNPTCTNFEKKYYDTVCPDLGHTYCKVTPKPTKDPTTGSTDVSTSNAEVTRPGGKVPAEIRPGKNGERKSLKMTETETENEEDLCTELQCEFYSTCKNARGIPYCACPEHCSKSPEPVCGSNGKTYLNACSLKVDSCNKKKGINITRNAPCGIPYQNAIHYWPMNNITADGIMFDLRGRSQAFAYNDINSKSTNQLGMVSSFDGLDDWIRIIGFQEKCITDPSVCVNGLSLGVWLKMLGGDYIISGGHYGAQARGPGFRIFHDSESKQYRIEVATRSDLWRVSLHTLPKSWIHLLFTWNKKNGLQLYLNGRFIVQDSGPNKIDNLPEDIENDQVLVIGKPDTFLRLRSYGRFEIAHLVIWDYPLPAMDVKNAYKAMVQTNPKSTVCCYYKMNDRCTRYPCYRFQNPDLCKGIMENTKCICPDIPGPRKCEERIFTGKCIDTRPDCSHLASQPGYCDYFQQQMEPLCPAACNFCGQTTTTAASTTPVARSAPTKAIVQRHKKTTYKMPIKYAPDAEAILTSAEERDIDRTRRRNHNNKEMASAGTNHPTWTLGIWAESLEPNKEGKRRTKVPEPTLSGRNQRRKLSREILIFSILGCVAGIILLFLVSIYSWKVYRNRYTGSFIPPRKCASDPELVVDEFSEDKWTKKYIDPSSFQIKDVPPKKRALPIIPPRPPQPKYQPPDFD